MAYWIPNIFWMCDPGGQISYLNSQWYQFTGQSPEGNGYRHSLFYIHPDDRRRVKETWKKEIIKGRKPFRTEFRLRSAANDYRWFVVSANPVLAKDQSVVAWVGSATDIHEQKAQLDDMRQIKEAAEQADRMKTYFLANMSHEIRTPLGAILGFSELLAEEGLPETERREFVQVIERSGKNLMRIVDDILDLSKIEAGCLRVECTTMDPRSVIQEAVSLFSESARTKGLWLQAKYEEQLPEKICADATRLSQILSNLLSNAIKFTKEGGIAIDVATKFRDESKWFVISVQDTGIGIHHDQIQLLFRPFAQAHRQSNCGGYNGTGLGLALSRRLAEAMGGHLDIHSSELDKGTCFSLYLPLM